VTLRTPNWSKSSETKECPVRSCRASDRVVGGSPICSIPAPHGRAMAQIGAVFNELERALIAERTTEALSELRAPGRVWNHCPLLGGTPSTDD
jgi:hypothetical protein